MCLLTGSLLGALYVALRTKSYVEAITENIMSGGDNCARAIVLGGLFGATRDVYIPENWFDSVKPQLLAEVCDLALQVSYC